MTLRELQEAIADERLTVQQVADICGVTRRAVYYWLNEEKRFLSRYERLISLTIKNRRSS